MGSGTTSGAPNAKLVDRLNKAVAKIGGAQAILNLPKQVRDIVSNTNNLEYRVKMLELIANNPNAIKQLKAKEGR